MGTVTVLAVMSPYNWTKFTGNSGSSHENSIHCDFHSGQLRATFANSNVDS